MRQLNGLIRAQPIPAAVHAKKTPDGLAEFVRVPLRIIRAGLIDVANSHSLDVRLLQEMKHYPQALSPHSDKRDVDLVAGDRKSTRLNSSHPSISYAVFCLKKKKKKKK